MKIHVVDLDGKTHALEAEPGWRVMEIIRDWGVPIKAECGGACQCATCHVFVADDWLDRLPPKSDEEEDRLADAPSEDENSRLSCQIIFQPELDGLTLTLAPETKP
ncbi:MAG: 2Fe-2S iron-sulfur cluster-binding protein [Pseudomonadota bacterium]